MSHDLSDTFSQDAEIAAAEKHYQEVMLARIADLSQSQKDAIVIPDPAYHASKYSELETLDPEMGQGLGVWFRDDLDGAAHFCVSRCSHPMTGERYEGVEPTIYEAKLNVKNFAVFPNEQALYSMSIPEEGDPDELHYAPGKFNEFSGIRETLKAAGYDGIYLMEEGTLSVLDSSAIEVVEEHDPIPIFNEHVRPHLSSRHDGEEPYSWALG